MSKKAQYIDFVKSPIGWLQILATDNFIVGVVFCAEDVVTESNTNDLTAKCVNQLIEYFEGKRKTFDLPLYQEGTDFQKKVWNYLTNIPPGNTVSYSDIAVVIGSENSTRAIGAANGKNKIAIVVPCHRVVGANGNLTGYVWEPWRKEWLLKHERKITNTNTELFDA
jgi:methylated-DNA-[protein]-cysteine S-methyltransferase